MFNEETQPDEPEIEVLELAEEEPAPEETPAPEYQPSPRRVAPSEN